jgi:ACS family glucarate transporter-like MFS transporter
MSSPIPPPFIRIRWRIMAFLFGFGLLAYLQQKTITVAAEQIMPRLHLSQVQLGALEWAFVVGYAAFQMPGGMFGQRFGARRTFVIISLVAFMAMMALPVAPELFAAKVLFAVLFGSQLVLGVAQAAIFPVSAGVFADWFPPRRWAFVQGLQTMGMQLGAAITPAVVTPLMIMGGWQWAVAWTTLPALLVIAGWGWYARNNPRAHRGVGPVELAEIGTPPVEVPPPKLTARRVLHVFRDRNALLLFVSYVCMNYVFYLISNWVFLYLIQERKLPVLESGFLAVAPPLGAAFGAGLGGIITGVICKRLGYRWGYRLVPLVAMPLAGILLLITIHLNNPYLAVTALTVCYGMVELTEASYWGCVMSVGRADTMMVSGFMNTGGNLGGIIGIPIVAYLSGEHLWNAAFLLGTGFAVASAVCWLWIDSERPVFADDAAGALAQTGGAGTDYVIASSA